MKKMKNLIGLGFVAIFFLLTLQPRSIVLKNITSLQSAVTNGWVLKNSGTPDICMMYALSILPMAGGGELNFLKFNISIIYLPRIFERV